MMKTIRLLYPDYVSGGLETYYFGANLMAHILPENENQPLIRVNILSPTGEEKKVTDGIYGKEEVVSGIVDAMDKIEDAQPDKIITIGGNCMVSQAPFDYLHGKYGNLGLIWIDAHPDVSATKDGYPNAHAMVLRSLLGQGDAALSDLMKSPKFDSKDILYIGLQDLHDYQRNFLDDMGVRYKIQTEEFVTDQEIRAFAGRFDHVLVHFDIDVLDERFFHATYFANPDLIGDGSGGGKMTLEKLSEILQTIQDCSDIVGFTIAEYLPFEAYRLHKMFSNLKILTV
ncbi:arginase family protein [Megasphaera massiliensis]|uniref:arginase family protein n=1 Tax=Megasphaera massiliensis TaxID=1232428 RepID=UPI0036F34A82